MSAALLEPEKSFDLSIDLTPTRLTKRQRRQSGVYELMQLFRRAHDLAESMLARKVKVPGGERTLQAIAGFTEQYSVILEGDL